MNNKPLISIITVSFNAVKTIEQTILSVVNQTYPNIEYVIIDGGSTDGTVDIIKKYEDKIAYWVSKPDKGIYDAMNKGIEKAKGDYLFFLGADDTLFDDILCKVSVFLKKRDIVYGNIYLTYKKKVYNGKFNSFRLIFGNIPHQGIFYNKRIFKKYRYDLTYKYLADYYLNLLCWKDKTIYFKYIPLIITNYNDFNGVSAVLKDDKFIIDRKKIFIKTLPFYCIPFIYMIEFAR